MMNSQINCLKNLFQNVEKSLEVKLKITFLKPTMGLLSSLATFFIAFNIYIML